MSTLYLMMVHIHGGIELVDHVSHITQTLLSIETKSDFGRRGEGEGGRKGGREEGIK